MARHFAYQVLQHAVSLNWAALDPAVKANFKTVAIHCISSWTLDLEAEERFVKAAAVQFVARLMLLEWPQRYDCHHTRSLGDHTDTFTTTQ